MDESFNQLMQEQEPESLVEKLKGFKQERIKKEFDRLGKSKPTRPSLVSNIFGPPPSAPSINENMIQGMLNG